MDVSPISAISRVGAAPGHYSWAHLTRAGVLIPFALVMWRIAVWQMEMRLID